MADDHDELIATLEQALRQAGVDTEDPEFWSQLRSEVESAVQEAVDEAGLGLPLDPASEGPGLRVLQGGVEAPESEGPGPVTRVVRVQAPLRRKGGEQGRIAVGEASWQTVLRAGSPRAYRLTVDEGQLDVALDGELVERVLAGQSLDVEGALIRVRAASGRSRGRYQRLPSPQAD
jgi:hypothetical protein